MAAVPKGYAMGRMLALACLTIIHELASVPVRDHHSPSEPIVPFVAMTECIKDDSNLQT